MDQQVDGGFAEDPEAGGCYAASVFPEATPMATLVIPDWDEQLDRALEAAAARLGCSKEAFVRESLARLLAPVTTADEPTGAALLAQIRSVATQANHFDGLLDELPARGSGHHHCAEASCGGLHRNGQR